MRWTLRISFLLFLAWTIFMVSPFVAFYDLGKAVEAKDLDRITERVNFNALRTSLSKQILREYLKNEKLDEVEQDFAAQAGAAVLNPVIEELVSPQALVDLLEDGWPQQATVGSGETVPPLRMDLRVNLSSLKQAWRTFIASESQGFRAVTIPLPANVSKDKQFHVTMRIRNTTWRLSGIELPAHLRDELAKRAAVATR
jgi:hypothetical protein